MVIRSTVHLQEKKGAEKRLNTLRLFAHSLVLMTD